MKLIIDIPDKAYNRLLEEQHLPNRLDIEWVITHGIPQKSGHWIHFAQSDDCSECGWSTGKYISPSKYCPNCGAKMESEE